MKKFYFLVMLVLSSLTLSAQEEGGFDISLYDYLLPGTELITDAWQLSSNASDEQEGLHIEYLIDGDINTFWHSDWHGKVPKPHYITVELAEPTEGYVALVTGRRTSSTTCQYTNLIVKTSTDGVTYTEGELYDMPYHAVGEYVVSLPFYLPEGTKYVRVQFYDNNTQPHTDAGACFHMAELQIYGVDGAYANEKAIEQLLLDYDAYLTDPENTHFNMGEGFGQYNNYEAEKLFLEGLQKAMDVLEAGTAGSMTIDEVQAIVSQVKDNYAAVLASEVLFSLTDGYYRLVANLEYRVETETGDVDIDGNPVVKSEPVTKALYGALDDKLYWGTKNDKDCRFLWRLNQKEGGIQMINVALGEQLANYDSFSAEADTLMGFDYAGTENGHDVVYIRFASAARDLAGTTSVYIHQMGHKQGLGESSLTCGWQATWNKTNGDKGTSEWYLEPVSEEEAQELIAAFELVKNHDLMVMDYEQKVAQAEAAIETAQDLNDAYDIVADQPYFTSADQFTSLWTEVKEGSVDNLFDGDSNTFWHSNWSDASKGADGKPHIHSFELSFAEPISGMVKMYMQRRNIGNDHPTEFSVYGTNDDAKLSDPNDAGWDLVCKAVKTPWWSGQADVYSQAFNIAQPYKHLRFYLEYAAGGTGMNGFFHMAALQLYPAVKTHETQFDKMGEVATTLAALVAESKTFDHADLTVDQYQAFVAALDAFLGMMADPAVLRNAISNNQKAADIMVEGTQPGYWSDMSAKQGLQDAIDKANAYLNGGVYVKEELEALAAEVAAAAANVKKSANPIRTDKWYRIHFTTAEDYETYGWSTAQSGPAVEGGPSLIGRYMAPGVWVEGGEGSESRIDYLAQDVVTEGTQLYVYDADVLDLDDPNNQYSFVALSDSTFAIRHRATGLYLQRNRVNNFLTVSLSTTPVEAEPNVLGYGQFSFRLQDLDGVSWEKNYFNFWRDHQVLQTWTGEGAGGNCSFCIEEAGDILGDEDAPVYQKTVVPAQYYGFCFPTSVRVDGGSLYTLAGTFADEEGTQYVALSETEEVEAGVPFVYVISEGGEYNAEATTTDAFYLGNELAREPGELNGMKGAYYLTFITTDHVVFAENKAKVLTSTNAYVEPNQGYIVYGANPIEEDGEYDVAVAIDGKVADGIQNTLAEISKGGNVYTLGGQLAGKVSSLKEVKRLGRGTYIVNGVKVLVR